MDGAVSLSDHWLQSMFLDYIEKMEYSEFYNSQTGKLIYIPVPKRGNLPYAINKGRRRDEIIDAMSRIAFDEPVHGFRNLRRTRLLFVTLTFDPRKKTAEEAWASLKSTRPEGSDNDYNVINRFDANISKILGKHGKLVSKEAQSNGYPAPHVLIVLDDPVIVRRKRIKGDIIRWFIDDESILRRLGKDAESRKKVKRDYIGAIDSNPVWKHGFFDIEGVVSENRFKGRKHVCSYLFKYLSKCLTKDNSESTNYLDTISESRDHNTLVALWTHFCNKCFRNRDITYGKGFRDRIGLLSKKQMEPKSGTSTESSPWTFMGTIDSETYNTLRDPEGKHPQRSLK